MILIVIHISIMPMILILFRPLLTLRQWDKTTPHRLIAPNIEGVM